MEYPKKFARNVFAELTVMSQGTPNLSGPQGDLFILPDASIAGIRLKVPITGYLEKANEFKRSLRGKIVSTGHDTFPVVIDATVTVSDGKSFIDGEEISLLS